MILITISFVSIRETEGAVGKMKGIICMTRICSTTGAQHRDYDGFHIRPSALPPVHHEHGISFPSVVSSAFSNNDDPFLFLHSLCHFIILV